MHHNSQLKLIFRGCREGVFNIITNQTCDSQSRLFLNSKNVRKIKLNDIFFLLFYMHLFFSPKTN